jgi:hypothetical protein
MTPSQARRALRNLKKGEKAFVLVVQSMEEAQAMAAAVSVLTGDDDSEADGAAAAAAESSGGSSSVAGPATGLVAERKLQSLLDRYPDLFPDSLPSGLPPKRRVGHVIKTVEGAIPPFRKNPRMSPKEMQAAEDHVKELLEKKLIEPTHSPYGAPILFVVKKDGNLRMCVDYRALNKITIRDRYPLPRIDDLFDKLRGATVFSSLDLQSGYYQVQIPEEDVPKTAFVTHMGQFQYRVLCLGLTNAPSTFQRMMNDIFAEHLGKFVLVYLDDLLVFSRTPEEHYRHLQLVFDLLREHKLYCKKSKCEFNKPELRFVGRSGQPFLSLSNVSL